jgi:hypothetical protein
MNPRSLLAGAAAAVVAAPYATTALPFRQALFAQAAVIAAIVAALLAVGLATPGAGARLRRTLRWPAVAAALYLASAVLGAVVGVAHGNPLLLVAGQFLSMALLPAGFVAVAALAGDRRLAACAAGLCTAVVVASLLHLVHWLRVAVGGGLESRLLFANNVSVVGPALAALLLSLAALIAGERRVRWAAAAGAVLIAAYVVGSGVRGLWLATPVGVGGLLLLSPGLRRGLRGSLRRRRGWWVSVAAVGLVALAATAGWLALARPSLLASADPLALAAGSRPGLAAAVPPAGGEAVLSWEPTAEQRGWALGAPFAVSRPGTYRLRVELAGAGGGGGGGVAVQWLDAAGRKLGETAAVAGTGGWRRVDAYGSAGAAVRGGRLIVRGGVGGGEGGGEGGGRWFVRRVEVVRIGPSWLAAPLGQLAVSLHRLRSLTVLWDADRAASYPSLDSRLRESRRLLELFGDGNRLQQLFGRGLGAVYRFDTFGYDDLGRRRPVGEVNYIHNFYLFLLFKLGLVGAVLVLAALAIWGATAVKAARALPPGLARSLAAAVAAGWLAYCLWSASSAAILEFRIAPLWGFLLAALAVDTAAPVAGRSAGQRRKV